MRYRRSIINGHKLNQPIEKIYNQPNFLVKGNYSNGAAKNLLIKKSYTYTSNK